MFRVFPLKLAEFFESFEELRRSLGEDPQNPDHHGKLVESLHRIAGALEHLTDLGGHAGRAAALADRVERQNTDDLPGRLAEFRDSLQADLERRLFFGMTAEETRLFTEPDLEPRAADRFPSAAQEIGQASRCLALELPTASAYHSVRALEVVLQTVTTALGIARGQNWQAALDQIEKELRIRRESQDSRMREWVREWDRFYADVAKHFYHLKAAQRNPVMHWSTETVDGPRARLLRTHTIGIVEDVSRHLSEASSAEPVLPPEQGPDGIQG